MSDYTNDSIGLWNKPCAVNLYCEHGGRKYMAILVTGITRHTDKSPHAVLFFKAKDHPSALEVGLWPRDSQAGTRYLSGSGEIDGVDCWFNVFTGRGTNMAVCPRCTCADCAAARNDKSPAFSVRINPKDARQAPAQPTGPYRHPDDPPPKSAATGPFEDDDLPF